MSNRITGWSHILVVFWPSGPQKCERWQILGLESKQNGAVVLRTMEVGPRLMRTVRRRRAFNCTKLSWLYDALTKRTLLQKMKIELDKVAFIIPMIIHISWMHGMIMFLCHIPSMVKTPNSWLSPCTVNQWTCDENQCWLQKRYNTNFYGFLEAVTGKRPCRDTELVYMWGHDSCALCAEDALFQLHKIIMTVRCIN